LIAKYYQAADVYVHATKADSFPTTILEAMACGLPVVASNVGGIPEQVDDGITGFLVPLEDPRALEQKVVQLLQNDTLRNSMREAACQKAQSEYNLDNQIKQYLNWYQRILASK
jgi:glycosyltransferase involved in cell wall biosynthesis